MRRGLRIAAWGLAGFVGLPALAVVATNVFLRTSLFGRLVNSDPESLAVDCRGAKSHFPGLLSFDAVTLRTRDQNIELQAVLHDVTLRVSLADLLGRRFHVTRLRARTLRFRLRERLGRDEATPARLARYPRIEGFADPPLLPASLPPPDVGTRPWRIVIEDLAIACVEEIWIDSWNWTGGGSVGGGFELLPGREARVGSARLEISAGELRHGGSVVAERIQGSVWCELPRFDTAAYPGNEVWKIVTGGSALRGELASLAFLSPDGGGIRVSGGSGPFLERVGLKDGAGSVRLTVTARDVTVREGARTFRGTAKVDFHAPKVDFRGGDASLAGTEVVLTRVTAEGAPIRPWAATFSAPTARLVLGDGSLDARLVGALLDARPIVALMPSGLGKWVAGLLHLENLRVEGRLESGPSRLALTSIRLTAGDFSMVGAYRSRPGPKHGKFRATKGPLSISFQVPGSP